MILKNIEIKKFRGISDSNICFDNGLNILVGPNNCGKSSILEAIYMGFQFLKANNGISSYHKAKKKLKGVNLRDPLIAIPDLSYLAYDLKKSAFPEDRIELNIETDIESFKTWATFSGHNMNVYAGKDLKSIGSESYRKKISLILEKPPNFCSIVFWSYSIRRNQDSSSN